MNTIKVDSGNTLMIAHRGLSGIELENTCSAFVAAGNRSYFGIETDVHVTADGQYIISMTIPPSVSRLIKWPLKKPPMTPCVP